MGLFSWFFGLFDDREALRDALNKKVAEELRIKKERRERIYRLNNKPIEPRKYENYKKVSTPRSEMKKSLPPQGPKSQIQEPKKKDNDIVEDIIFAHVVGTMFEELTDNDSKSGSCSCEDTSSSGFSGGFGGGDFSGSGSSSDWSDSGSDSSSSSND